jgi:hypothetical protein
VTDYFSEKIERTCAFYEAQSRKIDAKYLAEVEKLASRFDWVLADFIRSKCGRRESGRPWNQSDARYRREI